MPSRFSFIYCLILTATIIAIIQPATGSIEKPRPFTCPDNLAGETKDDCTWAIIARELILSAPLKKTEITLKSTLPSLYAQMTKDSKYHLLKRLWGSSLNNDEFAKDAAKDTKDTIVHPVIIDAIEDIIKIPKDRKLSSNTNQTVHAGIEHTYGYLFSTLKTPFGFKRDRWVRGEIEEGFGITKGELGPLPNRGTLFSNVTYFLGQIAFRDEPQNLDLLKKINTGISEELRTFHYQKLKVIRINEDVNAAVAQNIFRKVTLRTDIVPFIKKNKNSHLIVYSVKDPAKGPSQLITAFPVQTSFVEKLTSNDDLGTKLITTRYNAYVEGVTGKQITGRRTLVNELR
ncbi:MAG: hypothetical protein AABZ06_09270 [Bdellovibrionota bacterium]